jgi:hypothetical protein
LNINNIDFYNIESSYIPIVTHGTVFRVYGGGIRVVATIIPDVDVISYKILSIHLRRYNPYKNRINTFITKHNQSCARSALEFAVINKHAKMREVTSDKNGHLCADIYLENMSIRNWLIECNYNAYTDIDLIYHDQIIV